MITLLWVFALSQFTSIKWKTIIYKPLDFNCFQSHGEFTVQFPWVPCLSGTPIKQFCKIFDANIESLCDALVFKADAANRDSKWGSSTRSINCISSFRGSYLALLNFNGVRMRWDRIRLTPVTFSSGFSRLRRWMNILLNFALYCPMLCYNIRKQSFTKTQRMFSEVIVRYNCYILVFLFPL